MQRSSADYPVLLYHTYCGSSDRDLGPHPSHIAAYLVRSPSLSYRDSELLSMCKPWSSQTLSTQQASSSLHSFCLASSRLASAAISHETRMKQLIYTRSGLFLFCTALLRRRAYLRTPTYLVRRSGHG